MSQNPFDADHLLDGYYARLAASQRQIDLDTVLGGWKPDPTGARLHGQHVAAEPAPDPVRSGASAGRRRGRVDEITDAIDLGGRNEAPEIDPGHDGSERAAPRIDRSPLPVQTTGRRPRDPRLLPRWAPGAWIGAQKRVCEAVTAFGQSPRGPVVDVHAPQALLALWAPRPGSDRPLPGRWPSQVLIADSTSTDPVDAAAELLLPLLPPGALLWLCDEALDWALLADLVLHHEPALRPFQMQALRGFAEAERLSDFRRVNNGYARPVPGRPVQRR